MKCLGFLAEDGERLGVSWLERDLPASLKAQARETAFLGGVLDYLLGDEKLLVAFSESARIGA